MYKQLIIDHETRENGLHKLNGMAVEVINVRERKSYVIADVLFINLEADTVERYNGCVYPKAQLQVYARHEVQNV